MRCGVSDPFKRLVLEQHVTKDDIELVAWNLGWIIWETDEEVSGSYVDIWLTQDQKTRIHVVDDRPVGLLYFTVHGDNVDLVEERIQENFDLWPFREAISALRDAPGRDEKLIAAYATALTAPVEQSEAVEDAFRELAQDTDPGIRQAVVIATGYAPLSGLIRLVEELRDHDPVEHVRENARILLDGLRADGSE